MCEARGERGQPRPRLPWLRLTCLHCFSPPYVTGGSNRGSDCSGAPLHDCGRMCAYFSGFSPKTGYPICDVSAKKPTSDHFPRQGVDICKPSVVTGHTSLSAVQKVRSIRVGPTEIQIAKGLCLKVKSHSYHTHVLIMSQSPKIGCNACTSRRFPTSKQIRSLGGGNVGFCLRDASNKAE
jgi:hypothetical protein